MMMKDHFPRSDRALELRDQGLSYNDIAARMDTNKNNISALISQARKRRKVAASLRRAEHLKPPMGIDETKLG